MNQLEEDWNLAVTHGQYVKQGNAAEIIEFRRQDLASFVAEIRSQERPCTCHPDDGRPETCAKQYALSACKKVGAGGTAVTREMLTAAHGVTLESGDVVLSARLLERIYLAMDAAR
jgi:hypothetical protein